MAENAEEKTAEFVNSMCQITLETFWTQEVKGKMALNRHIACWKGWEPDGLVLLGESLPESLSLLDKGIPPSSSGSIDSGTTSFVRDVWSREFREVTGGTAHRRSSEPAVRLASNIDCGYPRKLVRTNEADTLSRADERGGEEFTHEESHGLVE